MSDETIIQLKEWNSATRLVESTGENISVYTIAKSLTRENFARLFDEYLNLGGKGFEEGKQIGLNLRFTHRTLQRLAICFALGIVSGLAEQDFTDARNETAVQSAKKISQMIEIDELPLGPYI